MTTETFTEALVGTRSQLDQWRRRHLKDSADDEAPAVAKRASIFPADNSGPLTRLEEINKRGQAKRADDAKSRRDRAKQAELNEQLADQKRGVPKTAKEFARRLKSNF